jgi:hypothetical protein
VNAIDIELSTGVQSKGVAYYRLPDHLFDFLKKVEAEHRIIGFEWTGDRNLGVILGEKL